MRKLLVGFACVLLCACTAQKNLLKEAQTPEETAYALYGTFVVYEEGAAVLVTDTTTPDSVKQALRQADAVAKPAADALLGAARQVVQIQTTLAAGGTADQKLEIASANLAQWIVDAKPKIIALQCAVNSKQGVCEEK